MHPCDLGVGSLVTRASELTARVNPACGTVQDQALGEAQLSGKRNDSNELILQHFVCVCICGLLGGVTS